ncbi:MAG: gliding motility-associated C-terminal domain-containing protein [Bacteroidetes bacterium]|nr:gliding motility-associated C-terminal domain-containing protein [Bacteroidota bacterium]
MKNLCFKIFLGLTSLLLFTASGYAQPLAATVNTTTSCGPSSGTATANATGGTGSYQYHWYPSGLTTTTINNQPAGSGSVTVWDGVDSVNVPYTIASTPAASVAITVTRDSFCTNGQDTLTANANNPTAVYVWSGGTLSGTSSSNPLYVTAGSPPAPGNYTYTVVSTDANGCTATASKTIRAKDVSISATTIIQPSCNRNNGSIQVTVQPQPPASRIDFYKNGTLIQSGSNVLASNLLPDVYTVTVYDPSTGCSAGTGTITLTDNSTTPTFNNVTVTPEQCYGDENGAIRVNAGNCGGGCVYTWSYSNSNNTDSALSLAAGTYYVSVSNSGCTNVVDTIIVPGPASKLTDTLRLTADHCGRHDGTGIVLSGGGTPPYSFVWSQGTPATPADSVYGLAGDSVIVIVTDSHGCADTLRDSVSTTLGPTAQILPADTICKTEHNGALVVEASGVTPLTYRWTNGSTTTVAGGLSVGSYNVTVTDAVGCSVILTGAVPGYNAYISLVGPYSIYRGETATLTAFNNVPVKNAYWVPYIDNSTGATIIYDKPQVATTYTVTLIYGQACELHDTATVLVLEDSSKMVVPNTFTPNNDGINDNFKIIQYQTTLESFHIWIYDRWGNKVYESTDPDFQWDGTDIYNTNKPLNTSVFSYAIEYKLAYENDKRTQGGNISLIK